MHLHAVLLFFIQRETTLSLAVCFHGPKNSFQIGVILKG